MKMSTHQDNTRGVQVTDLPEAIEDLKNTLDGVEIDIRYRGDSTCMQGIVLDNVVIPGIIKAVNCHDDMVDALNVFIRAAASLPSPNPFSGTKVIENAMQALENAKK